MPDRRFLVIDGDELVYKASFGAQYKEFYINFGEGRTQGPFQSKADAAEWLGDDEAESIDENIVVMPEDKAVKNLDDAIKSTKALVNPSHTQIFLTGGGNFRDEVATLQPYKGNRVDFQKPHYHGLMREMLIDKYKAKTIEGMEADDALSITAWQHRFRPRGWEVVISTQDKDLNMVPGLRHHPRKGVREILWAEARLSFFKQLLTGDSTDNIPGIYRIAEKTALKILLPHANDTYLQLLNVVLEQYRIAENNPKIRDKMPDGLWGEERITEIARLLWMRQEKDQMWEYGVDYYG